MATTENKNMSYALEINSTIEKIEAHVEKGTPTGVKTIVGTGGKKLSKHQELLSIGNDFEKLQGALESENGTKISSLLTSLGEHATLQQKRLKVKKVLKTKRLIKLLLRQQKQLVKWQNCLDKKQRLTLLLLFLF